MPLQPPAPLRHDWDCTNQISRYPGSQHPLFRGNRLVGLEIEALHPRTARPNALQPFGVLKLDGSLRAMLNNTARHCFELATHAASGDMLDAFLLDLTGRLRSEQCETNTSCGLHIHVDMSTLNSERRHNLVFWWAIFEDLFFAIQPPSRRSSTYSRPASQYSSYTEWANQRYSALNTQAYSRHQTYEWRLGAGTVNYRDILTQVQLIDAFVEVFSQRPALPNAEDPAYIAMLAMDNREFLIHFLKDLTLPTSTIKDMLRRIRAYNPSHLLQAASTTAVPAPAPTTAPLTYNGEDAGDAPEDDNLIGDEDEDEDEDVDYPEDHD